MRDLLHVGCGSATIAKMPEGFRDGSWRELRFDIDPAYNVDFVGTMLDMQAVESDSMDALYSSHNIEHVYAHEVHTGCASFTECSNRTAPRWSPAPISYRSPSRSRRGVSKSRSIIIHRGRSSRWISSMAIAAPSSAAKPTWRTARASAKDTRAARPTSGVHARGGTGPAAEIRPVDDRDQE